MQYAYTDILSPVYNQYFKGSHGHDIKLKIQTVYNFLRGTVTDTVNPGFTIHIFS